MSAAGPVIRRAVRDDLVISMEVTNDFERHRVDTLFSKEPETIRWIDELLRPGETFWDVGANVGVFTLYAALRHGARLDVRAFEPAHHNYFRLCQNLALNGAGGVQAYCVALGSACGSAPLRLASAESGSANHSFAGTAGARTDTASVVQQGCLTLSVDALVETYGLPRPHHVKVDIDGYEEAFVQGARRTLRDPQLRSLLIEVTDAEGSRQRIVRELAGAGFGTEHPLNFIDDHSRVRRERSGHGHIQNIIFSR